EAASKESKVSAPLPATTRRCDIAPAAAGATDRLATIDPFADLAEAPRPSNAKRGQSHEAAAYIPHNLPAWSLHLHRYRVAGRTPFHSVYRSRDLHRLLFRDVLGGLALCRPCHRTEAARPRARRT